MVLKYFSTTVGSARRTTLTALLLAAALAHPTAAQTTLPFLPDTTFFPEGLDADAASGRVYVTSLRHRTVWCGRPGGPAVPCAQLNDLDPRPGAITGVAVDAPRGLLWLTAAALPMMADAGPADTARTELLQLRLADGRVQRRWRLGTGRGVPGELAVTPGGEVLVSDGTLGVLYRLAPDADTVVTITSPLLRSPQGIAVAADGRTAWIADWSRGLRHWTLATNAIVEVAAPPGESLRGLDGLRRHGAELIGVQNGATPPRVVRLTLAPTGLAVTALAVLDVPGLPGEPTVGAVLDGVFIYVATSHWPFMAEDGTRRGVEARPGVVLRGVAVGDP